MKVVLTSKVIAALQTALASEYTDKKNVASSVNILRTTVQDVERIKREYDTAKKNYEESLKLVPGNAEFLDGILTWDTPKDNRPDGWIGGWAYTVESRSGGPAHQITGSVKSGKAVFSCNCTGSRFGETCWAVKAIQPPEGRLFSNVKVDLSTGRETVIDDHGISRNVKREDSHSVAPDFGLIKEEA